MTTPTRHVPAGTLTRRFANPMVRRLVRMGIDMKGARELQVRGRTTGEWRSVPVNPMEVDGHRYLVAPRGETQWVRNLRAAGSGRIRWRRRDEEFRAIELDDAVEKAHLLRTYLDRWGGEVGRFFEGLTVDSSDAEFAAAAPGFPVFRIIPVAAHAA